MSEMLWGAHEKAMLQAMNVGPKMQFRLLAVRNIEILKCLPGTAIGSEHSQLKIERI